MSPVKDYTTKFYINEKMLLQLILITFIIVYIWDISGFVPSVKRFILKKLTGLTNPDPTKVSWPPLDCSRCMTVWICLTWLLICGHFTIPYIAFVMLMSFMTIPIGAFLNMIYDILSWLITKVNRLVC